MNKQVCESWPEIININRNEPLFDRYSDNINKSSGICNNINDSFERLCVPNAIKNINVKVFDLMSRTNETRYIKWFETCTCKCRLDPAHWNNKQRWNNDKCRCECKELIGKEICYKAFIWNASDCECECDKSCDVGEYWDYENSKYRKGLIDNLV